MKNKAMLSRVGAVGAALFLLIAAGSELRAQPAVPPAAEVAPAKQAGPEDLSQAELLKSYLQVREQLHAAQLAIVNNRLEAEATARAQAAAITEKLDAIKAAMAVEREHQQAEATRLAAERERQQAEAERANRTILFVAAVFAGVGLLAMLLTALFQWRAVNRLTEVTAMRAQLPAPAPQALLSTDSGTPFDKTVAQSSQRLLSTIDRMERRINDLEHTAVRPVPVPPGNGRAEPDAPRRPNAASDQAARIIVLLSKGGYLLSTNKPRDAVACYDEVLKLDANHAEALVKKGAALERMTQDDEAMQCYDRAIKADGKMTLAYLYKGGVCNRLGRHDEALKCYEQALQTEKESTGKPAVHA